MFELTETENLYLNAEWGVLGCLLFDADRCGGDIFSRLRSEDFIHDECRCIFDTARRMSSAGDTVDFLTVRDELGPEYEQTITELCAVTISAGSYGAYVDRLVDWSVRHQTNAIASELQELCLGAGAREDILAALERGVKLLSQSDPVQGYDRSALLARSMVLATTKRQYLDWGFSDIGRFVHAKAGSYIVVGARPSVGKTAFALNAARHMSRTSRVLFLSLEMDADDIANRMAADEAHVDFGRLQSGESTQEEFAALMQLKKQVMQQQLTLVCDGSMTVDSIAARVRKYRPEVVFIDYLGLISTTNRRQSEYERVSEITRGLQQLAKTGVCVVCLSQLNRAEGYLRGSGQIEQDADVILMLEPVDADTFDRMDDRGASAWHSLTDEQQDALRLLRITKNRNGRTGTLRMTFDGAHQHFAQRWPEFLEARRTKIPHYKKPANHEEAMQMQLEGEGVTR